MSTIRWQLCSPSQFPTSAGGGVADGRTAGLGDVEAAVAGADPVGLALGGGDEQAAMRMAANAIKAHRTDIGFLQSVLANPLIHYGEGHRVNVQSSR